MKSERRKELILEEPTEEAITEEDIEALLEKDLKIRHYQGFEISGKVHIGTGLVNMRKVAQLQEAGIETNVLLADWHTWMNDKLEGDLEKIKEFAVGYFKEALKASLKCVGGDPAEVNFVLGSDLYHNNDEYWKTVIDVSRNVTRNRMERSIDVAGRKMEEGLPFARMVYPAMQVADLFNLQINLAHGGTDQRKAHVVARDAGGKIEFSNLTHNGEQYKPSAIHTHLLLGLEKPPTWPIPEDMDAKDLWTEAKMSKSKPDTCVFIHDPEKDVKRKIMNGFCPQGDTEFNPILDWTRHIVFPNIDTLEVERPEKYGGDLVFNSQEELEQKFGSGELHPEDLKKAVGKTVAEVLKPARKHFEKPENKRYLEELEEMMVTR